MKRRWKVVIGVSVLGVLFIAVFLFFMIGRTPDNVGPPPEMVPLEMTAPPGLSKAGDVDRLLNEMDFGSIAFNAPTTINIDESPQVQLLLSLATTVEELKQSLAEQGKTMGATIKVSDRMEAHLSGRMFHINAITPEVQAISKIQKTEWRWEVHPKEEGKHKLHLTLTALLEVNGESTPRAIRTFNSVINVNVSATQKVGLFFKNNWQWLWAAVLVPVGGLLLRRRKNS